MQQAHTGLNLDEVRDVLHQDESFLSKAAVRPTGPRDKSVINDYDGFLTSPFEKRQWHHILNLNLVYIAAVLFLE